MKVIFLDIDGVLNTSDYICAIYSRNSAIKKNNLNFPLIEERDKYGMVFDPRAVANLEFICFNTNAKVVISSTWRLSGLSVMQNMFKDRNINVDVIDVTPCHNDRNRGEEIKSWLDNNIVSSYVILDDDTDMLKEQYDNFIKIDDEFGLTHNDATNAINILNKNNK